MCSIIILPVHESSQKVLIAIIKATKVCKHKIWGDRPKFEALDLDQIISASHVIRDPSRVFLLCSPK